MTEEIYKVRRRAQKRSFISLPVKALSAMKLSQDALLLYCWLLKFGDNSDDGAFPKKRTLASLMFPDIGWERAKKRIEAAGRELIAKNMVEKEANPGKINVYWLTDEDDWITTFQPSGGRVEFQPGLDSNPGVGLDSNPTLPNNRLTRSIEPDPIFAPPPAAPQKTTLLLSNFDEKPESTETALEAIKESKTSKTEGKKPADTTIAYEAWKFGYEGMFPRSKPPLPSARMRSVFKRLIGMFGMEETIDVLQYMFKSKDSYLIKTCFAVEGITDAQWQSLRTQMLSGVRMTNTLAHKIDKDSEQTDAFDRVLQNIAKKYNMQRI